MPPSSPGNSLALRLSRLRENRVHALRNVSISTDLAAFRGQIEQDRKRLATIHDAWDLVPDALRSSITPVSHSRGVLTVRPAHHAAWSQFDLWLRSGGLRLLQSRARATLTRVKPVG